MTEIKSIATKFKPWMALWFPTLFVAILWLVWLVELEGGFNFKPFGVRPRSVEGLIGIIDFPFLHGDWKHLINNSFPMLVLGTGIYYFYRKVAYSIYLWSWIIPGIGVWLIGVPGTNHIGASGMVYAFVAFIFFSGIFRQQPKLIALSLAVVFFYGYMIWGIFPMEAGISWEGHLAGGLTGIWLAFHYRKIGGPPKRLYSWDLEEEEEEEESWKSSPFQPLKSDGKVTIRYIYKPEEKPEDEKPGKEERPD